MEIGSGYSSWLGAFSKPGALPPLSRSWWANAVASGVKGVRGETPLHWALASGDAARAKEWLGAGGGFEADAAGSSPIHWLASAGACKDFSNVLKDDALRAALEPEWSKKDRFERDAAGLLVLARKLRPLAELVRWHPIESVSLGARLSLGLCDALVAQDMRIQRDESGKALEALMDKHGIAMPSKEMPKQLSAGVWTQDLWKAARDNFLTPGMRARAEARELEKAAAMSVDKNTAPSKRI